MKIGQKINVQFSENQNRIQNRFFLQNNIGVYTIIVFSDMLLITLPIEVSLGTSGVKFL